MARLIGQPVTVRAGPGGEPAAFYYRQWHVVAALLDSWREVGQWWDGEDETITYRVVTRGGGVFELTHTPAQRRWLLYKAYD